MPLNTAVAPFPGLYPYFQLAHVANRGAAFGLFSSGSLIFTILAVVVAAVIVWYNFSLQTQSKLVRIARVCCLGCSGQFDRPPAAGHVTDFLDFDLSSVINVPLADWAVFNVADMAIVAGVILLAIVMIKDPASLETVPQRPMTDTTLAFSLDLPGKRLDQALAQTMPDWSRVQWQRYIKEGFVTVNGAPAKPSMRLKAASR